MVDRPSGTDRIDSHMHREPGGRQVERCLQDADVCFDAAEHDPIARFRAWLVDRRWITEDEAARIQAGCDAEASEAADWAEQQPDPVPEDALKHLFA